jgi:hypothetical protein
MSRLKDFCHVIASMVVPKLVKMGVYSHYTLPEFLVPFGSHASKATLAQKSDLKPVLARARKIFLLIGG